MKIEFDGKELELFLERGQITTISYLLEEMSIACGHSEDYLTDRYNELSDDIIKNKCGSCVLFGKNSILVVYFDIIEYDDWNVQDTIIKITRIS